MSESYKEIGIHVTSHKIYGTIAVVVLSGDFYAKDMDGNLPEGIDLNPITNDDMIDDLPEELKHL